MSGMMMVSRAGTPHAADSVLQQSRASVAFAPSPVMEADTSEEAASVTMPAAVSPLKRAQLEAVVDLQLVLPDGPAAATPAADAHPTSSSLAGGDPEASPLHSSAALSPPTATAAARPDPPSRPVMRGLLADVIDEMTVLPRQQVAEVVKGIEITPGLMVNRPTNGLDEDAFGRRTGRAPPPFGAALPGQPPPYEEEGDADRPSRREGEKAEPQPTQAERELAAQATRVEEAQARLAEGLQRLDSFQAQAQATATRLEGLTKEAQERRGQSESVVQQALQEHAELVRQQLAAAAQHAASLQTGVATLQNQLADLALRDSRREAAGAAAATAAAAPAPEDPPGMAALLEGVRRLESQMDRQVSELQRQQLALSEERVATRVAELTGTRRAERADSEPSGDRPAQPAVQVIPIAPIIMAAPPPPPPPRPASPPRTAPVLAAVAAPPLPTAQRVVRRRAETGIQTSARADERKTEKEHKAHEEKVARFTDYLLHGVPGGRRHPEGFSTPPFRAPQPPQAAELLLAMLRPPGSTAGDSSAASGTQASLEASRSSGELPSSASSTMQESHRAAGRSYFTPRTFSEGELVGIAEASPGELSGRSSPGEVYSHVVRPGLPLQTASSLGSSEEPGEVLWMVPDSPGELASSEFGVRAPAAAAPPPIPVGSEGEAASTSEVEALAALNSMLSEGEAASTGEDTSAWLGSGLRRGSQASMLLAGSDGEGGASEVAIRSMGEASASRSSGEASASA